MPSSNKIKIEPSCDTCRPLAGEMRHASASAPRLFEQEDVLRATGGKQQTEFTHAVDELLFKYRVRSLIECSLPDRTPHLDGAIVRTRCDLVLNIGHECATRWMSGYEEAVKRDAELEAHEQRVARVRGHKDSCDAAEATAKEVVRLKFFVDNLEAHCGDLHAHLVRVARGGADRRLELPRRGITGRTEQEAFTLTGAELFDRSTHPDEESIRTLIRNVATALQSMPPEPDINDVKRVARELDRLDERAREAQRWVDARLPFFTEQNFAVAIALAGVDDVQVRDGLFVTGEYTVGLGGITERGR